MSQDSTFRDAGWRIRQVDPNYEPWSTGYGDVRARQLEGRFPGNRFEGVWSISGLRVFKGWGAVKKSEWPNDNQDKWPPNEPPDIDERAKRWRLQHYHRLRSLDDCIRALALGGFNMAVETTDQWFTALRGMIELPKSESEINGSHNVFIHGVDVNRSFFVFNNSWGSDWGNNGTGLLPFEYIDAYMFDAWIMRGVGVELDCYDHEGIQQIEWTAPDLIGQHMVNGGGLVHGCEINDGTRDERMGWAIAIYRDGYLDVEELFVRPEFRRQGVARQLTAMLSDLSQRVGFPLRIWVPWGDYEGVNASGVSRIADLLGLELFETGTNWAEALGVSRDEPTLLAIENGLLKPLNHE